MNSFSGLDLLFFIFTLGAFGNLHQVLSTKLKNVGKPKVIPFQVFNSDKTIQMQFVIRLRN